MSKKIPPFKNKTGVYKELNNHYRNDPFLTGVRSHFPLLTNFDLNLIVHGNSRVPCLSISGTPWEMLKLQKSVLVVVATSAFQPRLCLLSVPFLLYTPICCVPSSLHPAAGCLMTIFPQSLPLPPHTPHNCCLMIQGIRKVWGFQKAATVKRMQKGFQTWQHSKALHEVIYRVYVSFLNFPFRVAPVCCLATHSASSELTHLTWSPGP